MFYDWISASIKVGDEWTLQRVLDPLELNISTFVPCKPAYGYTYGYKYESVKLYCGGEFCGGTALIVLSGEACRLMDARFPGGCDKLVQVLSSNGWKFTRYDRAIDLPYSFLLDVQFDLASASVTGRYRSWSQIASYTSGNDSTGTTIYIGSYKSSYFIRLYDKGAESGEAPGQICRFEVVSRGVPVVSDTEFFERLFTFFRPIDLIETNKSRCPVRPYYYAVTQGEAPRRAGKRRVYERRKSSSDYFVRIAKYVKFQLLSGGAKVLASLPTQSTAFNRLYYDRDTLCPGRQFCYTTSPS